MSFIPGTPEQQRDLLLRLKTAFPNIKFVALEMDNSISNDLVLSRRLKSSRGETFGYFNDGQVFIDSEKMNLNSPMHEYSHVWTTILKHENQELYWELIDKIKQERVLIDQKLSEINYANLTREAAADEVLADLVGAKGSQIISGGLRGENRGLWHRIQEDVNNVWKWVKNRFSNATPSIRDWRVEDFKSATLNEVVDGVTKDLLSGKEISKMSSEQLQHIESNNTRLFEEKDSDIRFQIIGEKGAMSLDKYQEATFRIDNLHIAREMEADGQTPSHIRLATGWEKGVDGLWRHEVPDIILKGEWVNMPTENRLVDYVENPELFAAYPELNNAVLTIGFNDSMQSEGTYLQTFDEFSGQFQPNIVIDESLLNDNIKLQAVLTHEIQHAIQEMEGFAVGGSLESATYDLERNRASMIRERNSMMSDPAFFKNPRYIEISNDLKQVIDHLWEYDDPNSTKRYDYYHSLSGEVEARNASARINMSAQERLNTLLSYTSDVAPQDQIVLFEGVGPVMSVEEKNPLEGLITFLDPQSIEQFGQNINDILFAYSSRSMGAIVVESYLRENAKLFGKEYLKKHGIKTRNELSLFTAKLQTKLRQGKGKERIENRRLYEELKTEKQVTEIIDIALAAEQEMMSKINMQEPARDVMGSSILSSQQWNELSHQQQEELKETISKEITDPHTGIKFKVDFNLADPLQKILNAGFATGQSDSGTISDHPGYRYVEDSKTGKYNKGECIPSGSCSYLTFWKPEAKGIEELGRKINTQQQIDTIRKIALKNGFVCQDTNVFYQPSIRLSLPHTNDGQSHQEILKQASQITNQKYPDLYEKDFWKWLDLRDHIYLPQVVEQHGGEKTYTDQQVIGMWNNLAKGLEQSQHQNITIMEKDPEKKQFEKIDYNKYKRDISLPDFLINNFGFYPDKGSSSHYPKLKNDSTGEVLVIKKNNEGYYTYFNVHDDRVKGCSILDFMQDRLSKDDSAGRRPSLITVAQTLDGYLKSGKVVQPDNSKFYIESSIWNPETNFSDVKLLRPIVTNEFLKGRGFSKETLEHPLFKGVFYERDYNKDGNVFTNTAIKLYNLTGLSGLSQRNDNFKGCLGNRFDSMACSIPNKDKKYSKVFIAESFLDCVAHFELNRNRLKNESVAYFSSEGAITSGQIVLLDKFIDKNRPNELATIFDRDLAGIVYDLKLLSELKSNANSLEMTLHEDKKTQQIFLYISDSKPNREQLLADLNEKFSSNNFRDLADNPSVELVELNNTNSDKISFQVTFPRDYNFAERAASIINDLRFPEKKITIEKSFGNDFNDDLKATKSERGISKTDDWIKDQYKEQTNNNNIELSL